MRFKKSFFKKIILKLIKYELLNSNILFHSLVLGGILIPNEIDSYIDDILTALQDNTDMQVTREDIENELKRFIEYGVPLEHAKQTLLKKYSRTYSPQSSERTLLTDLKPGKNNVHVLSRIVYINDKQINVKGENKTIFYGILGDESGTLPFTAWADLELQKGDVVDITNAYTKEWTTMANSLLDTGKKNNTILCNKSISLSKTCVNNTFSSRHYLFISKQRYVDIKKNRHITLSNSFSKKDYLILKK